MQAPPDSDQQNLEQRLSSLLLALREPSQRVAVFARSITSLAPSDAVVALGQLLEACARTRTRANRLLVETAMLCLLQGRWPTEHLELTRATAAETGADLVYLLLGGVSDAAEAGSGKEIVPNYTGTGRTLTLGERRAIARRPDRRLLARALSDPHPMVAARVLENPRVNEADVIFMASRRGASPAVLREIAVHPRWRLNRRVSFALLCNPGLPPGLGLSLLPGLDQTRLSEFAAAPTTTPLLCHVARALLALRDDSCQLFREMADS